MRKTRFYKSSTPSSYKNVVYFLFGAVGIFMLLQSCQGNSNQATASADADYENLCSTYEDANSKIKSIEEGCTPNDLQSLEQTIKKLHFNYNEEEIPEEKLNSYKKKAHAIDSLRETLNDQLDEIVPQLKLKYKSVSDTLVAAPGTEYAVFLMRGDTLFVDFEGEEPTKLNVLNADSEKNIASYSKKSEYHFKTAIRNSAVYLIEIKTPQTQYINLDIAKKNPEHDKLMATMDVITTIDSAGVGDFHAKETQTVKMKNLFMNPRKISLRSNLKSAFSGSNRSVVALQLPKGSLNVVYQLRISTSKSNQGSDGDFFDRAKESYREIKFLGLPIYESTKEGNSVIRELLGYLTDPPKEEDAYCDMYVFHSQSEAKRFQDHKPVTELKYDVDLSTIGTQSCTNCMDVKGSNTLYLGFENSHTTKDVYVWLEALATTKSKEYYRCYYTSVYKESEE